MAKLEAYDKTLDYSLRAGHLPRDGMSQKCKKRCMRLLVSSNGLQSEGVQALEKAAQEADIRVDVGRPRAGTHFQKGKLLCGDGL